MPIVKENLIAIKRLNMTVRQKLMDFFGIGKVGRVVVADTQPVYIAIGFGDESVKAHREAQGAV